MDSTGLYDHFRSQVVDVATPYLWSDDEVWRYMNDAYRMFVRNTGGIADFTSDATRIAVVTGEPTAEMPASILRVSDAFRVSDGQPVKVINYTDLVSGKKADDYGFLVKNVNKPINGALRYMLIGRQKHLCEWTVIPSVDDEVQMTIYRLPLASIDNSGQSLDEVDEEHHLHLTEWMKHLAYKKHDAETFNPKASAEAEAAFNAYCWKVKSEWERMKHKTRIVQYGGL